MNSLLQKYFQTIEKLIPKKTPGNSVGLDIGSGDCKLVELAKEGNTYWLINWAIEPVKNNDVAASVKKILSVVESSPPSVYTSVFGKGTLIRYIDMPSMSISELRNSFALEADKYFPFAQDQIYTDCYILDARSANKQMAVLSAAAKKEMVDARIKLLKELGLDVDFIGVNPIALVNVLHALEPVADQEKAEVVALLDMGESVSNLTIVEDKLPRFTRDIFIGGRDITKRISNVMGVSFQEAEELKRNPGKRLEEIVDAAETAIMNMVRELRLSFDYFTTERNKEVQKILLTGGASLFEGISEIFEKNLEVAVGQWNPLSFLEISSKISKEELNKNSLKLGVALGLALYHYV